MSWKRLDSVVSEVLSRIETGDDEAATSSVSRKSAESTKLPASATGQRRREGETRKATTASPGQEEYRTPLTVSRRGYVTPQSGLPHPVAYPRLVIDNGSGRTTEGRKLRRPAFRSSPEGEASKLVLVVG